MSDCWKTQMNERMLGAQLHMHENQKERKR